MTKINDGLLLQYEDFHDQMHNIDHLVYLACNEKNPSQQSQIMRAASSSCERFHSYFHYEESYFRQRYADVLFDKGSIEQAIHEYKLAIFQNHLNQAAHHRLIQCYDITGDSAEKRKAEVYASSFNIDLSSHDDIVNEQRPFESFAEYVVFATNSIALSQHFLGIEGRGFWKSYADYNHTQDFALLEKAIMEIKACHQNYHRNAAIIYRNHAIIYEVLGENALANNAKVKSSNLFSAL